MSGDTATAVLRALLAGDPYPPPGVPDTPASRALWDEIAAGIDALPGGVIPDIPAEWADMPGGSEVPPGPKGPAAPEAARWDPGDHPRNPPGGKGGGRFTRSPGGGTTTGEPPALNPAVTRPLESFARGAATPGIRRTLERAARHYRTGDWGETARLMLQAAQAAADAGDPGPASGLRDLAALVFRDINPPVPPGEATRAVRDFAGLAAGQAPRLVGDGQQKWDGTVEVLTAAQIGGGYAGTMSWGGHLQLLDEVAAALDQALSEKDPARRTAQADADSVEIVLHEMLHGVENARARAARAEWDTLPRADQDTLSVFSYLDKAGPAGGAYPVEHTLADAQAVNPGVSQAQVNALTARQLLRRSDTTSSRWDPATGQAGPYVRSWSLTAHAAEMTDPRDQVADHVQAYAGSPAGADIEEGFNELGTVLHMPQFTEAAGVAGWETPVISIEHGRPADNPEWARARDELAATLRQARDSLRQEMAGPVSEAAWQQAIDRLTAAITDLTSMGDTTTAIGAVSRMRHLGSPAGARLADQAEARLKQLDGTPMTRHATLGEYARRLADPQRIRDGHAWGHYPDKTARALDWVQAVARAEHRRGTNTAGTKGWARVAELADEINREGPAGKTPVMARQAARAAGRDPDTLPGWSLADAENLIRERWLGQGPLAAFKDAKHLLAPLGAPAAAAAEQEEPAPPPARPQLTPAGAEAARLAAWAWDDPPARLAAARQQVNDLARDAAADPAALREIRDAGQMLARLADGLSQGPAAAFREADHLRVPAGGEHGGQFTRKPGGAPAGDPLDAVGHSVAAFKAATEYPPAPRKPPGIRMGPVKQCYANAAQCAIDHHRPYCEGYALSPQIGYWVHHAWNLDGDGRAFDLTWRQPAARYRGRVYDTMDVLDQAAERGNYDAMDGQLITLLPADMAEGDTPAAAAGLRKRLAAALADPAVTDLITWPAIAGAWDEDEHPRGDGGKWVSKPGGETGTAARPLAPAGRFTMRDVPDGDPLWAKVDRLLATPRQGRGARRGELRRPAVPPYRQSVAKVTAAITGTIGEQGTLEQGRRWYPTEHQLAEQRARRYSVPVEIAAAVEAATSPRTNYATNQRVTEELLDVVPKLGQTAQELAARRRIGGAIMTQYRNDGVAIALGADISATLTGPKRRAYFDNIMWPGQTDQVTVDAWMLRSLGALGLDEDQQVALGMEKAGGFTEGIGRMLAADAVRAAADAYRAQGTDAGPDAVQAAYWIAVQKAAAVTGPARRGPVAAAAAGDPLDHLADDEYDAELLLDYLGWLSEDIPGRIDLGPPFSAKADGSLAGDNPAAWQIAQADPRWAALHIPPGQARQATTGRPSS